MGNDAHAPATRFGRQPAADLLMERGITVQEAANRLGLRNRKHLLWPLIGAQPPTRRIALGLSDELGLPVTDLFTPRSLRAAIDRDRNRMSGKRSA